MLGVISLVVFGFNGLRQFCLSYWLFTLPTVLLLFNIKLAPLQGGR